MDSIFCYALRGFRVIDLTTAISEDMHTQVLISSLLCSNLTIYDDIRGLLLIIIIPISVTNINKKTLVAFRMIRTLCSEQYDELSKQWMINKCSFDHGHHPE